MAVHVQEPRMHATEGHIGGFGRIHWLAPAELCLMNPFDEEAERYMIDHMNADHADALQDYCRLRRIDPGTVTPRLAAIDAEGFDLVLDQRLVRFSFEVPVSRTEDVRAQMVALARRARASAPTGA